MSKEIGDQTFEFLKNQYAFHVAEFLDDPGAIAGADPGEIAAHYHDLVAIGQDIALAIGPDDGKVYFWETVKEEGRTEYEINRLKEFINA